MKNWIYQSSKFVTIHVYTHCSKITVYVWKKIFKTKLAQEKEVKVLWNVIFPFKYFNEFSNEEKKIKMFSVFPSLNTSVRRFFTVWERNNRLHKQRLWVCFNTDLTQECDPTKLPLLFWCRKAHGRESSKVKNLFFLLLWGVGNEQKIDL